MQTCKTNRDCLRIANPTVCVLMGCEKHAQLLQLVHDIVSVSGSEKGLRTPLFCYRLISASQIFSIAVERRNHVNCDCVVLSTDDAQIYFSLCAVTLNHSVPYKRQLWWLVWSPSPKPHNSQRYHTISWFHVETLIFLPELRLFCRLRGWISQSSRALVSFSQCFCTHITFDDDFDLHFNNCFPL